MKKQLSLPLAEEITVDLFAGGGGWSIAYERATGQYPHVAINHDRDAISMHEANHPQTEHYQTDVFEVDPYEAVGNMPVGWLHMSPDCTHHSQAKGGQPRDRVIRSLSWVGLKWAGQVSPRIISLENVKQILDWGPLVAKRDPKTGRVIKLDGTVAAKGEHTPISEQYLVPCKKHKGRTWKRFVTLLKKMGYEVQWKRMVAADYGAPTTRDRLFMMARRDNEPIVWPEPTHYKNPTKGQKKWRSAAECIDWDLEGKSIFDRPRPLAEATMRRIARGIKRFVIDNPEPYLIHIGNGERKGQAPRTMSLAKPLNTIVASSVKQAVALPILIQAGHGEGKGKTKRWGVGSKHIEQPVNTITTTGSGGQSVAVAYMAQMNGGFNTTPGHDLRKPSTTITNTGSQQQLVSAHLLHLRGSCDARDTEEPLHTISAGGLHHGAVTAFLTRHFGNSVAQPASEPAPTIVAGGGGKTTVTECMLSNEDQKSALRVAAFLIRYYSEGGQYGELDEPLDTITTKDRLAMVTVYIAGNPYLIVDIKLRMLQPSELYKAQGFPDNYCFTHGHDGKKLTKSAQVRMCGNSVSPPPAQALIKANWTRRSLLKKVA